MPSAITPTSHVRIFFSWLSIGQKVAEFAFKILVVYENRKKGVLVVFVLCVYLPDLTLFRATACFARVNFL
jgi:hypothetical protein